MEKVKLEEGNAALERVLLMMKYDMGKTLNENKGISEQTAADQPKGYKKLLAGAYGGGGFGTNEKELVDAFRELKSQKDYIALDNYIKTNVPNLGSVEKILNGELGFADLGVAAEIQTLLKNIGVTMSYGKGPSNDTIQNVKITLSSKPTPLQDTKCLGKIKQYAVAGKPGLYKLGGTNYKFYKTGQYTRWEGNGPKRNGTWACGADGFIDLDGMKFTPKPKTPFNWTQAPTEEEVKAGKKVLKSGMMGDFVKKVQNQLKVKGINPGGVDGKFGKNTKNAVIQFQQTMGLKPDGVVGKSTYDQLFFVTPKVEPTNVQNQEPGQKPAEQPGLNPVYEPKAPEIQRQLPTVPPLTNREQRRADRMARRQQNAHVDPKPTIKESMKKTLKTKLVEKTQEKENLLIETKIITNRFNLLSEGFVVETVEDQVQFIDDIIVEMNYMVSQGYSSQVINEGLFSMLGSLFGGSLKSVPAVFGEYIANWLTKTLGVPEGSFIQSSIVALVGNLNIADYDKFFTDCRFASNKIADSLIEGYLIQMQKRSDATSQGASGFIVSALRNAVSEYFLEDKDGIVQILQEKIGDFICPKLNKVSSAIADKADEIKDKAVA